MGEPGEEWRVTLSWTWPEEAEPESYEFAVDDARALTVDQDGLRAALRFSAEQAGRVELPDRLEVCLPGPEGECIELQTPRPPVGVTYGGPAEEIWVPYEQASLAVGEERALQGLVLATRPVVDRAMTDDTITYTSLHSDVASVTSNGVVRGLSPGKTTLRLSVEGLSTDVEIVVTDAEVELPRSLAHPIMEGFPLVFRDRRIRDRPVPHVYVHPLTDYPAVVARMKPLVVSRSLDDMEPKPLVMFRWTGTGFSFEVLTGHATPASFHQFLIASNGEEYFLASQEPYGLAHVLRVRSGPADPWTEVPLDIDQLDDLHADFVMESALADASDGGVWIAYSAHGRWTSGDGTTRCGRLTRLAHLGDEGLTVEEVERADQPQTTAVPCADASPEQIDAGVTLGPPAHLFVAPSVTGDSRPEIRLEIQGCREFIDPSDQERAAGCDLVLEHSGEGWQRRDPYADEVWERAGEIVFGDASVEFAERPEWEDAADDMHMFPTPEGGLLWGPSVVRDRWEQWGPYGRFVGPVTFPEVLPGVTEREPATGVPSVLPGLAGDGTVAYEVRQETWEVGGLAQPTLFLTHSQPRTYVRHTDPLDVGTRVGTRGIGRGSTIGLLPLGDEVWLAEDEWLSLGQPVENMTCWGFDPVTGTSRALPGCWDGPDSTATRRIVSVGDALLYSHQTSVGRDIYASQDGETFEKIQSLPDARGDELIDVARAPDGRWYALIAEESSTLTSRAQLYRLPEPAWSTAPWELLDYEADMFLSGRFLLLPTDRGVAMFVFSADQSLRYDVVNGVVSTARVSTQPVGLGVRKAVYLDSQDRIATLGSLSGKWFFDVGAFTESPQEVPLTDESIDGGVIHTQLATGERILLTTIRRFDEGIADDVVVYLSDDDGQTWQGPVTVLPRDRPSRQVAYGLMGTGNGEFLVDVGDTEGAPSDYSEPLDVVRILVRLSAADVKAALEP